MVSVKYQYQYNPNYTLPYLYSACAIHSSLLQQDLASQCLDSPGKLIMASNNRQTVVADDQQLPQHLGWLTTENNTKLVCPAKRKLYHPSKDFFNELSLLITFLERLPIEPVVCFGHSAILSMSLIVLKLLEPTLVYAKVSSPSISNFWSMHQSLFVESVSILSIFFDYIHKLEVTLKIKIKHSLLLDKKRERAIMTYSDLDTIARDSL